jgi:hypothetical protein
MQVSYNMLQSTFRGTRAMRIGGMVERYGRYSIWIIDMAKKSLYGWHIKIHWTMTFFVHNACVCFGRSKQS